MPTLNDQFRAYLRTGQFVCELCKKCVRKHYCRQCDEFFFVGHEASCSCCDSDDHEGHRIDTGWKTGDKVRITYGEQTTEGNILLASENGRALMLAFEAVLGGYAGHMPVRYERGTFRDLIQQREVLIEMG